MLMFFAFKWALHEIANILFLLTFLYGKYIKVKVLKV